MAYSNVDWANERGDRKSITGDVITYNRAILDWKGHKQQAVAESTAEAEDRALVDLVQRAAYIRNLDNNFTGRQSTIVLTSDNQPAIDMLPTLGGAKRSKFI